MYKFEVPAFCEVLPKEIVERFLDHSELEVRINGTWYRTVRKLRHFSAVGSMVEIEAKTLGQADAVRDEYGNIIWEK
jgi:hypothetical protein